MSWSVWIVPGACFALEFLVLGCVWRWRTWRTFPVYSSYIVFVLFRGALLFSTFSHPKVYFLGYWLSAPVEILLTILAVMESFWRVFRSFRLLRWFRLVLPTAICMALGYSAWAGYHFPPVETSPVGAALIHTSVASHYVVLSIAILFLSLATLLHVPWRIHEHRFVLGFGVASLAFVFGGWVRAVFGSQASVVSAQAPPVGYLIALLIWLSALVHPVAEQPTTSGEPVEIVDGLKFQLRNMRSFVRKSVR